ncbi:MAG TPA: R3H domain-containing nucleic acid-binding protein [Acidimicrobiales bacterium]|nr:R3H domain-containing nucleic acid-binding protein [Acidimicrobiales bacterium]
MEWVETTGRSVDEAKDAALDKLGIDETDAEFEVLEEPRLGLFGRVRAEARVRARVRPNRPRPKDVRRDRNRRSKAGSGGGTPDRTAAPPPGAPDSATTEPAAPVSAAAPPAQAQKQPGPLPRAPRPARPRQAAAADVDDVSTDREGAKMDQDVPLDEQAGLARTFLLGLLASFETEGEVDVVAIDEDTIELAIDGGKDLHLLIGPGGATLTAVQEITRRVVQRQTGARNGRLLVDVSGYRRKRKAALERFVETVAADVRTSGVAKALEPMHAADRKVVHDTVNGLDGVHTTSEGEEPRRRVVISPS